MYKKSKRTKKTKRTKRTKRTKNRKHIKKGGTRPRPNELNKNDKATGTNKLAIDAFNQVNISNFLNTPLLDMTKLLNYFDTFKNNIINLTITNIEKFFTSCYLKSINSIYTKDDVLNSIKFNFNRGLKLQFVFELKCHKDYPQYIKIEIYGNTHNDSKIIKDYENNYKDLLNKGNPDVSKKEFEEIKKYIKYLNDFMIVRGIFMDFYKNEGYNQNEIPKEFHEDKSIIKDYEDISDPSDPIPSCLLYFSLKKNFNINDNKKLILILKDIEKANEKEKNPPHDDDNCICDDIIKINKKNNINIIDFFREYAINYLLDSIFVSNDTNEILKRQQEYIKNSES